MRSNKILHGVGTIGEGQYGSMDNGKEAKCYKLWNAMLRRCYSEYSLSRYPTYRDVTVCEDWCNYQNFAEWWHANYRDSWTLDKDIVKPGNRIYCPEYCRYVPKQINTQFNHIRSDKGACETGVCIDSRNGRFLAKVKSDCKTVNLGSYLTQAEARAAYLKGKRAEVNRLAYLYREEIGEEIFNALLIFPLEG